MIIWPRGKESTEVRITQIKGKEWESSYQKLKISPEERLTQTHENLFEIFRRPQKYFSIRKEWMYVTPTVNCPSQETEVTSTPTRPVDNVVIAT